MPSPSQVLQLEKFLPYRLSILAQLVSESLHDLYAGPFDLAVTEWRVMAALGRFAPLTASEVGQRIVMDKVAACRAEAKRLGLAVEFFQSNHEGALVDRIQAAREGNSAIVINAGAYTHTSVALLDALNAAELPAVEVHLSNIYKREAFRHHSYISPAAVGVIAGLGSQGYLLALQALARLLAR